MSFMLLLARREGSHPCHYPSNVPDIQWQSFQLDAAFLPCSFNVFLIPSKDPIASQSQITIVGSILRIMDRNLHITDTNLRIADTNFCIVDTNLRSKTMIEGSFESKLIYLIWRAKLSHILTTSILRTQPPYNGHLSHRSNTMIEGLLLNNLIDLTWRAKISHISTTST